MTELVFDCVGARAERWAVAPTLTFLIKVAETAGEAVHGISLRCQIRIEPLKRRYSEDEGELLVDLFGERSRWGETMKPLQLAFAAQMVPGFSGSTEIELPVPFTYDFEVAGSKYLAALEDGEVPLELLFGGTIFYTAPGGALQTAMIGWDSEAEYRLPVSVWRATMDRYFPHSAWLRVDRDAFDRLYAYRARHALPSWEHALEQLLLDAEGR